MTSHKGQNMKKILAADIGGTHSRFAFFLADEKEGLQLAESRWLKTSDAGSFGHLLENQWAPYFNSLSRDRFVKILFDRVLSGKSQPYGMYNNKITVNDIITAMDASPEEVYVPNVETGEEEKVIIEGVIDYTEIKSIIFNEDWYIDPETLRIEKKIISIAPIRHYYIAEDYDGDTLLKKIVFQVFLNQ